MGFALTSVDTAGWAANSTAMYLEEVPLDLVDRFVGEGSDGQGREWLTLTMEYGPDFHGHDRVLKANRVFHGASEHKIASLIWLVVLQIASSSNDATCRL